MSWKAWQESEGSAVLVSSGLGLQPCIVCRELGGSWYELDFHRFAGDGEFHCCCETDQQASLPFDGQGAQWTVIIRDIWAFLVCIIRAWGSFRYVHWEGLLSIPADRSLSYWGGDLRHWFIKARVSWVHMKIFFFKDKVIRAWSSTLYDTAFHLRILRTYAVLAFQ